MNWLQRTSRARRWTRQEWRLLAEAWLALLRAGLALRRWSLPEVLRRQPRPTAEGVSLDGAPLVRAVQRAAHLFPVPMLCLPQSLALAGMLVRRGQSCAVVLGARPQAGVLDAHAWVEVDGIPINSPPDSAERHPVFLREAFDAPHAPPRDPIRTGG